MARSILYIGPMFADKTQTIIRTANRYQDTGKNCLIITYANDNRNVTSHSNLTSHSSMFRGLNENIKVVRVLKLSEIFESKCGLSLTSYYLIAIEEAHFFEDLVEVFFRLRRLETLKELLVAGLDSDREQKGYHSTTLDLVPHVDKVKKLPAICSACGGDAIYTRCRFEANGLDRELIGGADKYYAICWRCREIYDKLSGSPMNSRSISPAPPAESQESS
jgi:thymidine kinase